MLETILADLTKFLGIHPLKGSGDMGDYFLLKISEQNEVWVRDLNPGVFFRAVIGMLANTSSQEDFFAYLMRANYHGQGTGGSTIAIDPNEKFLTLCLNIPYEVNYKIFHDKLEDFLNYLDFWREEIKNHEAKGN